MVAGPANQMEIQISLGVEEGQDQGTHALHQTTQMCLIESHHRHHHQAVETDILQCETQAQHCLMILVSTVIALRLQLTTHQSPQEGEHTRPLLNLVLVVNEKAVQEKSCQNSVTSVALNTLWKMPSSAVNVE